MNKRYKYKVTLKVTDEITIRPEPFVILSSSLPMDEHACKWFAF